MDEIQVNPYISKTEDTIITNKPENNFYEILVYLAIYLSIGIVGLIVKYIQEKFSGNRVKLI